MIDYKTKEDLSILYDHKESGDLYVKFRINILEITLKYQGLIKPLQAVFPVKEIIHGNFEKGCPGQRRMPPSVQGSTDHCLLFHILPGKLTKKVI